MNTPHQGTAKDFQDIWSYMLSKRANRTVPVQLQTKTNCLSPAHGCTFFLFVKEVTGF